MENIFQQSIQQGQGIGIVIISSKGISTKLAYQIEEVCSHNRAKYEALILGLETAVDLGAQVIEIFGDSQLIVSQVIGRARCTKPALARCLER